MNNDFMRKISKGMKGQLEDVNDDEMMGRGGEGGFGQTVYIDDKTITPDDLKCTDDLDSDAEDKENN